MTHHPTSHADLPSLLELAEMVATCIPFLPPHGQKNIGRVVEHMALIAQAGPEWMPIDSAPRDGSVIDLWNWTNGNRCTDMKWGRSTNPRESDDPGWVRAYFDSWTCYCPKQYSHWMPAPPPPPPKESE